MPRETTPGYHREVIPIPIPQAGFLDQAGAVTLVLSMPLGFQCELEKAVYIPAVAGAGAGASQQLRVRKGNATGTILASPLLTLANHVLGGAGISAAGDESASSKLRDADTISITKDAGTVFTTGNGTLLLIVRQRAQARR